MNAIVSELSSSLKSESNSAIDESLLLVAFCFENYHDCPNEAWPESIKSIKISEHEAELLKSDLVLFLKRDDNWSALGTAVWAFSKIVEKEDKAF